MKIDKTYIDGIILKYLPEKLDELYGAVEYVLYGEGKRIRPLLLLETYKAVAGTISEDAEKLAVALEYIHNYSLVHDDLPSMDDDDYRRGRESCHKRFGEASAILCGDALLNLAAETALSAKPTVSNNAAARYMFKMSGMSGMVHGQILDIGGKASSFDDLYEIAVYKTSALLKAAIVCGALSAGATKEEVGKLETASEKLGVAYQIADDLLDGDKNEVSFVSVLGREQSYVILKKLTLEAVEIFGKMKYDLSFLTEAANGNLTRKY